MAGHVHFAYDDAETGSTRSSSSTSNTNMDNVMDGMEELRYGIISEQPNLVKMLLSKVNQKTLHEYSAMISSFPIKRPLLHLAVMKNNPEILKILLDETVFRILINERDVDGYTPVMMAVDVGSAECFRILMDAGANLSLTVQRIQNERKKELHTLHLASKHLAPLSKIGGSMLTHIAAARGHSEVLSLLLQRIDVRLDLEEVDSQGCTPLMVAVSNGNLHCMNILLNVGARCADITNNARQNVLHLAARNGHHEILRELLKKPKVRKMINDEDNKRYTPLSWAVFSGNLEGMHVLLDHGADQHVRDENNNTLLHLACREGHSHILKYLLPTSLNFVQYKDWSCFQKVLQPFHQLTQPNSEELFHHRKQDVKQPRRTTYWWYLEDIKHINRDGRNCFHLAASSGNADSLKLLLLCYATSGTAESINCPHIDLKDNYGLTPLYYAARSSSPECVRFILQNGGNLAFKRASSRSLVGSSEERVLNLILTNIENGEDLIKEVFDDCVKAVTDDNTNEEIYKLDFRVICPETKNKLAVVKMVYDEKRCPKLQQHPLLLAFVHLDWWEHKNLMYYRLINHVFFLSFLSLCVAREETFYSGYVAPWLLFPFSILVLFFSIPYLLSEQDSRVMQVMQFAVNALPGSLAMYILFSESNNEAKGIAILISWLTLPLHARIVPIFGRQIALFTYVINETLKYALIFLYILLGFSFTFDILYLSHDDLTPKKFLQSYLYTILVILRARDQRYRSPHDNSTETAVDIDSYITRVIDELPFVGVIVSLLFVLVVLLALLNLFIVLAFRSVNEVVMDSYFHYKKAQVQMLFEKREVDNFLEKVLCPICQSNKNSGKEKEYIRNVKRSKLDTTIDKGLWNIIISRRKKYMTVGQKKVVENEVDNVVEKRLKHIQKIFSEEELKLRGTNGISRSFKK